MRVSISEYSSLAFYRTKEERSSYAYPSNLPVLLFPGFASIKFELQTQHREITVAGIKLCSAVSHAPFPPTSFSHAVKTADVNNDGVDERFIQVTGLTYSSPPTETKFFINILLSEGGEVFDLYSEDFFICQPNFKLDYWNDCDDEKFGYSSEGFKHTLFFKDLDFQKIEQDKSVRSLSDGFGRAIKNYQSTQPSYAGTIWGAAHLRQTIDFISLYDNIELQDLNSNEVYNISDISSEGTGKGVFEMTVEFQTQLADRLHCPVNAYEDAPYAGGESPESLTCGAFGVTINIAGSDLTYTLNDDPDVGVTETVTWLKNGVFYGSGSTVSLGGFGTYAVRIQKVNCIVTDSYVYADPCVMTSEFTVNNDVINGSTLNPPTSVSYEVYDKDGALVASALPYVALESATYTIKVISGSCERIYNVPVSLLPPVDCSFTYDLTKSNSNVLTISNVSEVSYSVEWLRIVAGDNEVSVGTGDMYTIDKDGLYIARVTANGCPKDRLFVYQSNMPLQTTFMDFQQFDNHTGQNLDITNFTLPHPLINTEEEINQQLEIEIEGKGYSYRDTPSEIDDYSIDFANNRVVFFNPTIVNRDITARRFYT